jgi:hypothetical protein
VNNLKKMKRFLLPLLLILSVVHLSQAAVNAAAINGSPIVAEAQPVAAQPVVGVPIAGEPVVDQPADPTDTAQESTTDGVALPDFTCTEDYYVDNGDGKFPSLPLY